MKHIQIFYLGLPLILSSMIVKGDMEGNSPTKPLNTQEDTAQEQSADLVAIDQLATEAVVDTESSLWSA
jgi:hypothetical protein